MNALNNMATFPSFPYFLKNSAWRTETLSRYHRIIDALPTIANYGNEIESTLNADCKRRKETLNTISGMGINFRKR